ncbi:MAG: hypothetical protein K940chlam7_01414 [Chlamydiae bacterium]|nr:hypothetical protein [Chlamydiota bacterium]
MLVQSFEVLGKIRRRLFGNAYSFLQESQFSLLLAQSLSKILKAQKGKTKLVTAYTDTGLHGLTEALMDVGFVWEDVRHTFFGRDPDHNFDKFHPYNPLSDLKKFEFDVILGSQGIDLSYLARSVRQTLKAIKLVNFQTCLHINKISILAVLAYFCPNHSSILEVGSYQCGTSIFMAQLCKTLGKHVTIYACDTFEGMPAATAPDRSDQVFFDSGMFTNNPINRVQKKIKSQALEGYIRLVKGDVVKNLPNLNYENIYLMFLDTDQYRGTQAGLDQVKRLNIPHIVVDEERGRSCEERGRSCDGKGAGKGAGAAMCDSLLCKICIWSILLFHRR